jgi:hypothetical protein
LIDNTVTDTSTAVGRPTLFEDGIQFIKDNDMQPAFVSLVFVLEMIWESSSYHRERTRTSFSASSNNFRMFSSDAPTYLFRISGPLTILGSLAFNIFPICLAISVLPHPGGPCNKMPDSSVYLVDVTEQRARDTFDMLDTQLLHQSRREYPGCESATEDFAELRIQTSDTHILKFEVGS